MLFSTSNAAETNFQRPPENNHIYQETIVAVEDYRMRNSQMLGSPIIDGLSVGGQGRT